MTGTIFLLSGFDFITCYTTSLPPMKETCQSENCLPGQRWVSTAEPELGLGTILQKAFRRVMVAFTASSEIREYALPNAILSRVRYAVGDQVSDGSGCAFMVTSITDAAGLLTYHGRDCSLPEGQLDAQLVFNRPQDRIANNELDASETFDLRLQTIQHQYTYQSSPLRGMMGGRIALIPHQLYVAESVVNMTRPRALLSDETGLGKTIEAALILHRKLLTGRARRALVLTPGALMHQWFVELLRRFSLFFSIFDEERCQAIEQNAPKSNPFLDDQLILCDINWLASNRARALQAIGAKWDMVIVDEAHHLETTPAPRTPQSEGEPPEEPPFSSYKLVKKLGSQSHGLLLLTATPEEMGVAGHFARLRLLDPSRYSSLKQFTQENAAYNELVPLIEKMIAREHLSKVDRSCIEELGIDPDGELPDVAGQVLDCFGPGRVIFRNTRRIIKGFPPRVPCPAPLPPAPRCVEQWLADFLISHPDEKVLAIVHSKEDAVHFYDDLTQSTGCRIGLFHEDMNLIQRDRQAAWFSQEDGAQLLITSEIGGEGRNFQFSHHLVMLDLPENPEIIEQRIGRLDRIGQTQPINIHVPYPAGGTAALRVRWIHEALNALQAPLPGAHEMYVEFRPVLELLQEGEPTQAEIDTFIQQVRARKEDVSDRIAHGRDRLLELHSYRAPAAAHWVTALQEVDQSSVLADYLDYALDVLGIHPEPLDHSCWMLHTSPLFAEFIPGFPAEGMAITFDRQIALQREDMAFMTWDHPLVHGIFDRILSTPTGNAAAAIWTTSAPVRYLLEAVYILEATTSATDAHLHLPATPIHLYVDESGCEWTGIKPQTEDLQPITAFNKDKPTLWQSRFAPLLKPCGTLAEQQADVLRKQAAEQLNHSETQEIQRLYQLQQRNSGISRKELLKRAQRLTAGVQEIEQAPLRLDALRCICCKKA